LKSPQTLKIETDGDHLFDDLHAKIVQNLRESRVKPLFLSSFSPVSQAQEAQEAKEANNIQPKTLPGPYIGNDLYLSTFSYSVISLL